MGYKVIFQDDAELSRLAAILRKSKVVTVTSALSILGELTRRVLQGEHIYIGHSRETSTELAITTLENIRTDAKHATGSED